MYKISVMGDSISEFDPTEDQGGVGSHNIVTLDPNYNYFYPHNDSSVSAASDTWWMNTINRLGECLYIIQQ